MINKLNELLSLDPEAISKLIDLRVKVNPDIINHPDITVSTDDELGILGVLRFISGEKIAVETADDRVVRFITQDIT
jgi:hypothetical protein